MKIQYLMNSIGGFIRLTAETSQECFDIERAGKCLLNHYSMYRDCPHGVFIISDDDGAAFVDIYVIDQDCIKRFDLKQKFQDEITSNTME